jgi:prepilin-type N-terminal cleavage/methylation domain-containing protein
LGGDSQRGFSLIEVLVSILITMIVMGAVFGLLTRGQRSFQREPEVADLQQSARAALDMVSKDILQGGAGLPPEFPALSRIRGGDAAPTDNLEIVGAFQSVGNVYFEPEDVDSPDLVNPNIIVLMNPTTNLTMDDPLTALSDEGMVIVYNNAANVDPTGAGRQPQWALARVTLVDQIAGPPPQARVTLDFAAYNPGYTRLLNFPLDGTFSRGPEQDPKIARVSVVRYSTQPDPNPIFKAPAPQVLMRETDFSGAPQAVGYLEDFQINYVVGVTAPVQQVNPPDPAQDLGFGVALTAENTLSSVRVSITGRSVSTSLEGASEGAMVGNVDDDFIRKTFSTNVNPRNMTAGIDMRTLAAIP